MLPLAAPQAAAQDDSYTSLDDTIRIRSWIGAIHLEGKEYVFNGDYTLSKLIWQSRAPMLRDSIAIDLGSGFSVSAEGSVAGYGSSYMEGYDWHIQTNNFDNWMDRLQHPDTHLDHYVTGAAAIGYELVNSQRCRGAAACRVEIHRHEMVDLWLVLHL
ncbi:MAG: omptin family outer membrane protease [Candidatus Devosia symbiotica]|nr:omptin family outer membrane protease [Candidatus Devosia symbiotica]